MRYINILLFGALALVLSACSEEVLNDENQNNYSDDNYFREAPQFNEAVLAQYSNLTGLGMYSRDYYFVLDLLSNDASPAPPLLGNEGAISRYTHGPSNSLINNLWTGLYRFSLRSNYAQDQLDRWEPENDADQALKNQYIGESLFFRAFAYDQLASLWGDVPLRNSYDLHFEYDTPRSSAADVYASAESDLQQAISLLPDSYAGEEIGRATRFAAHALLGRVNLHQNDFAGVVEALEPLAPGASHPYGLNPNFDEQFSPLNDETVETVFDVNHLWTGWGNGNAFYMFGGQETWGGRTTHTGRSQEYGFNDWANVTVGRSVAQSFTYDDENGENYTDPRAALTFYGPNGGDQDFCAGGVGSTTSGVPCEETQPYTLQKNNWRKYSLYEYIASTGIPNSNINTQVIRYADVLLMLAEAYIETGRTSDGIELINIVRERVGAFTYGSGQSQEAARQIVRRERTLELAGEQTRWFDLKRWGDMVDVLNGEEDLDDTGAAEFQDFMTLLPIPQREVDANGAVTVDNSWN